MKVTHNYVQCTAYIAINIFFSFSLLLIFFSSDQSSCLQRRQATGGQNHFGFTGDSQIRNLYSTFIGGKTGGANNDHNYSDKYMTAVGVYFQFRHLEIVGVKIIWFAERPHQLLRVILAQSCF